MSEFKASGFGDEFGSSGPNIVGLTTFTSPYYFVPPSGSTAERPSSPPPGMLRFNTDIGRLEVWRNDHWATILGESPNLGNQLVTNSAGGTGTRGLFGGGQKTGPAVTDVIDYISISTLGNAQDFGNLSDDRRSIASNSSRTRGIWACGSGGGDTIDYVTIASTGNAIDFGNALVSRDDPDACASQTRMCIGGGYSTKNDIEYITIASTGNGVDFGDLTVGRTVGGACGSSVRGMWTGGTTAPTLKNEIDYITCLLYTSPSPRD